MKITYYGTAAAEGWPAVFCRCESCEKAKALGGRNIRTRSQALIDDGLLLDFPPDTYMHVLYGGLDLTRVHSLLITHTHFDHFFPGDFWCRIPGIAYNLRPDVPVMTVCASRFAEERLGRYAGREDGEKRLDFMRVEAEKTFEIRGYTVTPLPACHGMEGDAHIYAVEKDGKSMLYGNDTGYFKDEVWAWFEKTGKRFDLVSLERTYLMHIDVVSRIRNKLVSSHQLLRSIFRNVRLP
ncbi:MAG: PhnP protein, partial [Clostridia bacterium]|nr:PhnP protein [Clostridia bacterium]